MAQEDEEEVFSQGFPNPKSASSGQTLLDREGHEGVLTWAAETKRSAGTSLHLTGPPPEPIPSAKTAYSLHSFS